MVCYFKKLSSHFLTLKLHKLGQQHVYVTGIYTKKKDTERNKLEVRRSARLGGYRIVQNYHLCVITCIWDLGTQQHY